MVYCRPELVLASCRKLDLGPQRTRAGYINHGATLDTAELLLPISVLGLMRWRAWHTVRASPHTWLTAEEAAAIAGEGDHTL